MTDISPIDRIFCAIDTPDLADALLLAELLAGEVGAIKLGKEFFTTHGPDGVRKVAACGHKIFLDLKYHDIPNTVAKAVQSLSYLPIDMLTIHSSGGIEMMSAANRVRLDLKPDLLLLGVTVLTTMNEAQLRRVGVPTTPQSQVHNLAGATVESGIPGLVCSAKELDILTPDYGDSLQFVTPGIRPSGSSADDQKRIVTPGQAAANGSNFIVVGRPIYQADSPRAAVQAINAELN